MITAEKEITGGIELGSRITSGKCLISVVGKKGRDIVANGAWVAVWLVVTGEIYEMTRVQLAPFSLHLFATGVREPRP